MLAMVASSTTISWATEMSTRAQPRWRWPEPVAGSVACVVAMDIRLPWVRRRGCGSDGGTRRGGDDDLVHHPGDRLLVGGEAEHEAAVQDDAREGGGQQVEVEVRGDLAAGPGPLEDPAARLELGAEDAGAELLGEVGVAVQGGDDAGHHLGRLRLRQAAVAAGH